MQSDYVAPEFMKDAFNCPHCNAYAQMEWGHYPYHTTNKRELWVSVSKCLACQNGAVWYVDEFIGSKKLVMLVYPNSSSAPMPSPDLPEDCMTDYLEARDIVSRSPRGAAALLRLVLQKLCKHLGAKGENINADIGWLVKDKGLSPKIQKALDIVRVIGNESVHPGELDLNDVPETTIKLFKLINLIVDEMITQPKGIDALFDELPEGAKNGIEKRDGKAPTS